MKKIFLFGVFILTMMAFASAAQETNVYFFYESTCAHCEKVIESGILENLSAVDGVTVTRYLISKKPEDKEARELYLGYVSKLNLSRSGVPFMLIEQNGKISYLMGDRPIIENSKDTIVNFYSEIDDIEHDENNSIVSELTLGIVVVSALIDSINPCAFGVLLFLMAVLLSMGSAKRALRSGMIYTFVIFLVYLAAGFGIMSAIGSINSLGTVKMVIGIIVLVGALVELKDFFFEGKGPSLKIPVKAKPVLEKFVHKGTFPAMIILGALVALVELPCTGGIYLAILSLISESGVRGIFYLIFYNFIFILPLVVITFLIYRGAKVDKINEWVQKNKRFMRLATGLIMIFLALSLIGVI